MASFAILAGIATLTLAAAGAGASNTDDTPGTKATATAAPVSSGVTIPDLWDPNRRLDRPATTALTGIRFTTTDDFPPFNFTGPDGRLTGFNVDLARAICRELSVPCTIQARPWDGLIDTVAAGRVDAALAGIAITPESRAKLDFSDVYLRPVARFVGRKGEPAPPNAEGLAGRKIAVAKDSTHEAYLAAFFPASTRIAVDTPGAAEEALKAGSVDLAFGDGVQLAFWLQSEPAAGCCDFVGGPYVEPHLLGQGLAIALPPKRDDLRLALNWALDSLYDKGVFAELYLRYFPVGYF
ncbi:MAG: transporter substrate-binding domain-containing protein [Candidatus Kaistia colombiensis]|nr:MAG: transporter substrate-binding domain-containing protein [Kaistia sp.]